eukprot:Mrub_13470.p1 GENE.Mrub_13470~~Mrub_13470.p1  ORF type:complete len:107 (+),score=10.43 Mrub_13470:163-483(+)
MADGSATFNQTPLNLNPGPGRYNPSNMVQHPMFGVQPTVGPKENAMGFRAMNHIGYTNTPTSHLFDTSKVTAAHPNTVPQGNSGNNSINGAISVGSGSNINGNSNF